MSGGLLRATDGAAGAPPGAPGRPDGPKHRPWYRRRALLVGLAVAVVLVVTVITDLPQHTSPAAAVNDERSVLKAIDTDVAPCTFAVQETFRLWADAERPSLPSGDRSKIPGLIAQDQAACSFTDNSIFDLSNIETPGSAAGRDLAEVDTTVTTWATSDALAAIIAVEKLLDHPNDAKAKAELAKAEGYAASDRRKADAEIAAANETLHAKIPNPALPPLPAPTAR